MIKFRSIWIILGLALLLRLILLPFGNHSDLMSLAAWGEWIWRFGTHGFYEAEGWINSSPTQLPIMNLLLAAAFLMHNLILKSMLLVKTFLHIPPASIIWWWEKTKYQQSELIFADLILIKMIALVADLIIGLIIYQLGKAAPSKNCLRVAALFLFLPFSWYISALWGQFDQLSTLLLLVSFLFLFKRTFLLSALFMMFAFQIKPTVVFFLPLYLVYFIIQKPKLQELLISLVSTIIFSFISIMLFSTNSPILYGIQTIYRKVFFASRLTLATKTFNFWQMIFPSEKTIGSEIAFLGLPSFVWAYLALAIITVWVYQIITQDRTLKGLLAALYLTGAGTYLFFIGMLDRYFFPGVVFLGVLSFYYPGLIKYFLLSSTLFWINLIYSWGYPILSVDLLWRNNILIRIFSLGQIVVFFLVLRDLKAYDYLKPLLSRLKSSTI